MAGKAATRKETKGQLTYTSSLTSSNSSGLALKKDSIDEIRRVLGDRSLQFSDALIYEHFEQCGFVFERTVDRLVSFNDGQADPGFFSNILEFVQVENKKTSSRRKVLYYCLSLSQAG